MAPVQSFFRVKETEGCIREIASTLCLILSPSRTASTLFLRTGMLWKKLQMMTVVPAEGRAASASKTSKPFPSLNILTCVFTDDLVREEISTSVAKETKLAKASPLKPYHLRLSRSATEVHLLVWYLFPTQSMSSATDYAGGNEKTSREEGHNRGRAQVRKAQTNTRMSELQFRELARGTDKVMEDRRYDDFKQVRLKQDQRTEDRMRTTKEEQQDDSQTIQPNRKGNKGTYKVISSKQEVNGELNKSRWHNVKEHTRGRRGDGTDWGAGGEIEKIKYSDVPQVSLQKTPYTGNHRGAGGNQLWDSTLPSRPSQWSGPQQGELMLMKGTEVSLQLFPCKVCNRKFASERLEKHVRICEKANFSCRQVFNSYANRTKGSQLEQFLKTHQTQPSRGKTLT
uniref:C2HC/C3H-type domain-containing protein n=1 Tax=Neolamprologus brichardi TaxID=32507 RepID=A0A3Q4M9Z1_NEOBR